MNPDAAKIESMRRSVERNGVKSGGTVFMSVRAAAGMLIEAGRRDDALALMAQAGSNDIVRMHVGELELVDAEDAP